MGKDSNGFEKTEIIHRGKVAYTVEKHEKRPFKVPARPTAFFDVDDTLVMWDIPEGIEINDDRLVSINCKGIEDRLFPNKHNIELLKKFSARGHSVVVWSGGGADWAEAVVDALGLNQYVDAVMNTSHNTIWMILLIQKNGLANTVILN
jgi:hypothetical protein